MSHARIRLTLLALVTAGVLSLFQASVSLASNADGPTKRDNLGNDLIRNNNAFGDSYPGGSRQMDYVVSNDDYTDIFVSDILIYMPNPSGQIRVIGGDLCVNSSVNVRNSDGNYTSTPNGTRVTDFRVFRSNNSLVAIDYGAGQWNYGSAAGCANGQFTLTGVGSPKDPDTGMYIYRLQAKANLAAGKFANGFHIVGPAGSYISQDSTKSTQRFGIQPSYPIPNGSNPQVPRPPNPYVVYTDVDIPFGPDCTLPSGSSATKSFDIYDADNVGNYDVQPQPFNVQIERYSRAGAYLGRAPLTYTPGRAISLGGGSYQPTAGNQQTVTFNFTARGNEKYLLRVYRLYYNNTLQFSIPYDSVFFYKPCLSTLNSTVRPNVSMSPNIAMPGQTLTGTATITYVGARNTPAQVDAQRLVWSDTNRDGTYDPGERVHVNDNRNNLTVPPGGSNFPVWTAVADPAIYGSRVCIGLFISPSNATTRTSPSSDIECSEIAKKPKMQVWGGDVRARGKIETSMSPFDGKQYGSWSEYGALSVGINTQFASGSGLNNGATGAANTRNHLTFANIDNTGAASYGSFTLLPAPPLAAQFMAAPSAGAPNGNLGSLNSGKYTMANLTITPSTIGQTAGKGKKIVIVATGTVTITGDIAYQGTAGDTFTSIDQIPQVIIIANKIDIRGSTSRIDAWLLTTGATGAINTCSDVALSAALNAGICPARLTVNGPIVTSHLYLRRAGGSGSTAATAGAPAEVFNLRADAYLWGQTQAAQNGKAQTVYSKELPPRF